MQVRARVLTQLWLPAFTAIALALPMRDAHAQIGGLIKRKAAERVQQAVDGKTQKPDSTSATRGATASTGRVSRSDRNKAKWNAEAEKIDAATLDATLRGVAAMSRILLQADSIHRLIAQNGGIETTSQVEAARYVQAVEEKRSCYDQAFEQMDYQRLQDAARAMGDPSVPVERIHRFEAAYNAMQEERNAMLARNDMEGRRRVAREFLRAQGRTVVNPRTDTTAAANECGTLPALSDAGRRAARNDTLLQRARALEGEAGQEGVKASGLPEAKFFVTRERLYYWMKASGAITWGPEERQLLERRRADLERVRRGIVGAEVAGG